VGFVRKLPHNLVASFRSTMEEAVAADLVLHVIDVSHPQFEDQRSVGDEVLRDLGIPADRVIEVYNKVDKTEAFTPRRKDTVAVSGLNGRGVDRLIQLIVERELENGDVMELLIPHEQSRLLAQLHEVADVREQSVNDDGTRLVAWVPRDAAHIFQPYSATELLKRVKVS
jgi:GTPase